MLVDTLFVLTIITDTCMLSSLHYMSTERDTQDSARDQKVQHARYTIYVYWRSHRRIVMTDRLSSSC